MLFRGNAGHRLEPVGVVGRALADGPVFHRVGDDVRDRLIERGALCHRLFERLEHVLGQTFLHDGFIEHHTAEQFGYLAHDLPP